MFTWICPQCGREVPPSYTECPDCKDRAAAGPPPAAPPGQPYPAAPPPPPAPAAQPYYPQQHQPPQQYSGQPYPPPQQQQYAPPPQYQQPPQYAQQPPHYAPPQYAPPPQPRGAGLPVWALTILFACGIGALVGGIYWLMQTGSSRAQTGTGPAPTAAVESPAAKPGAKTNPLQKYIEVSGVRFVLDAKKKTQARFVLINHSEADINGLAGNVTIWGRTQKSEEDAQGTFTFTTNLGPFESKELTVPLNTKLKIYELPDWQNVTADVQITAPAGGA
jgi:hypothetical protein